MNFYFVFVPSLLKKYKNLSKLMGYMKRGGGWGLPGPDLEDYIMTWKILTIF